MYFVSDLWIDRSRVDWGINYQIIDPIQNTIININYFPLMFKMLLILYVYYAQCWSSCFHCGSPNTHFHPFHTPPSVSGPACRQCNVGVYWIQIFFRTSSLPLMRPGSDRPALSPGRTVDPALLSSAIPSLPRGESEYPQMHQK